MWTGSGRYGIPQFPGGTTDYTGANPGQGCAASDNPLVEGSGGYLANTTGPLDPNYGYFTTGGDPAIVDALKKQPIKVSSKGRCTNKSAFPRW